MRYAKNGMFSMTKVFAILLISQLWTTYCFSETVKLKFATALPESSPGIQEIRKMFSQIRQQTGDEVDIKTAPGEIAGSEFDIARKMRSEHIQMGALSMYGLVKILPEIVILAQPGIYENADEADYLRARLFDDFADSFLKNGFVLLGMADVGGVYMYSKKNLADADAFKNMKVWAYKGNEMLMVGFKMMGVKTVSLDMADVNRAFDNGAVDTVYGPPMIVAAFNWIARVRYVLDYPFTYVPGAFIINRDSFEKLSPKSRTILKEAVRDFCGQNIQRVRQMNAEALKAAKEAGIIFVKPDETIRNDIDTYIRENTESIIKEGIFSRERYEQVKKILADYRALQMKTPR